MVVLLASSLPRGYAAPCLSEILGISRDLERHPFGRLMGVVQLLINISDADAFQPHGRAIVTAQKLRLLHAGVRAIAGRYRPHYQERFGVPVNHEDMLATIMAFSWLLIDGVRRLDLPLGDDEAEDLYYLWRVFALLMGIHPPGRPHDDSLIPPTIADAATFYEAYVRRNDTTAERNPYGVVLTQDNLAMMTAMIWWPLRLIGLGWAPRIAMTELLTPEELARVGVTPLVGHSADQGGAGADPAPRPRRRRAHVVRGATLAPPPAGHGRRRPPRRGPVLDPDVAGGSALGRVRMIANPS